MSSLACKESNPWTIFDGLLLLSVKSLAEANERILGGLEIAGNAVEDAALIYSQVLTEGLWRESFDTEDAWVRWLNQERKSRKIPKATWYYWLTIVGYLRVRGIAPERIRKDLRPYIVYKAAIRDGYSHRTQMLAEDAVANPTPEGLMVEASNEADMVWPAERPATATLDRMVYERRHPEENGEGSSPVQVKCWLDTASDTFGTLWIRNVATGTTHGIGLGHLNEWPPEMLDWFLKRLGIDEVE